MLKVHTIPALGDNYIWMIEFDDRRAVVIDPGDARPVIEALQQHALRLDALLITHGCHDHVDGIEPLLRVHPAPVYGPTLDRIPALTHALKEGDTVRISSLSFDVLDLPGHTRGHIGFYGHGALFSGDVLFSAGCGRLHNGTFAQMHQSLNKITRLPKNTHVYCAHEYSAANLQFARAVEPDNGAIDEREAEVIELRAQGLATVPTTLAEELEFNPFLRCHIGAVRASAQRHCGETLNNTEAVFTALRRWKSAF